MGLFDKNSATTSKPSATTIIAEGASISGELILTGNIQVDGLVKGTLRTVANVTISPTGMVDGTIFADKAIINGCFEGEVFSKNVAILSNGNLKGEVTSTDFTIEKGGLFLGVSKTVTNDEVVNLADNKVLKEKKDNPEKIEKKADAK